MKWFRFYADALNDPKVQSLSGPLFKFWVNLLCIAAEHGGELPEDWLYRSRARADHGHRWLLGLRKRGLIDASEAAKSGLVIHNWARRQYESDSSTPRVKRFRNAPRDRVQSTEADKQSTEAEAEENAFTAYEEEFGRPVPTRAIERDLLDYEKERPLECLRHSMKEAALAGADWRYAKKIVDRHTTEGCSRVVALVGSLSDDARAFIERRRLAHEAKAGNGR